MEYTNFSRKQAGVLYAANKDRRIMMTRECVKQMYNLADTRYTDNTELRYMHKAIEQEDY